MKQTPATVDLGDAKHSCKFCGQKFLLAKQLRAHRELKVPFEGTECPVCSRKFTFPPACRQHIFDSHPRCISTPSVITEAPQLVLLPAVSPSLPSSNRAIDAQSDVIDHPTPRIAVSSNVSSVLQLNATRQMCVTCDVKFKTWKNFTEHMTKLHPDINEDMSQQGLFVCPICLKKLKCGKSAMLQHMFDSHKVIEPIKVNETPSTNRTITTPVCELNQPVKNSAIQSSEDKSPVDMMPGLTSDDQKAKNNRVVIDLMDSPITSKEAQQNTGTSEKQDLVSKLVSTLQQVRQTMSEVKKTSPSTPLQSSSSISPGHNEQSIVAAAAADSANSGTIDKNELCASSLFSNKDEGSSNGMQSYSSELTYTSPGSISNLNQTRSSLSRKQQLINLSREKGIVRRRLELHREEHSHYHHHDDNDEHDDGDEEITDAMITREMIRADVNRFSSILPREIKRAPSISLYVSETAFKKLPYLPLKRHVSWMPQNNDKKNGNTKMEEISLTEELRMFCDYVSLHPEEKVCRQHLIAQVTEIVKVKWPDANVQPFGSFPAGLSNFLSDIDLTILDLPTNISDFMDNQNQNKTQAVYYLFYFPSFSFFYIIIESINDRRCH
jgi:hypothetical protein